MANTKIRGMEGGELTDPVGTEAVWPQAADGSTDYWLQLNTIKTFINTLSASQQRQLRAELGLHPVVGLRKTWDAFQDRAQGNTPHLRAFLQGDSVSQNAWDYLAPMLARSLGSPYAVYTVNDGVGDVVGSVTGSRTTQPWPTSGTTTENDQWDEWPGGTVRRVASGATATWASTSFTDFDVYVKEISGAGTATLKAGGVTQDTLDCDNGGAQSLGKLSYSTGTTVTTATMTLEATGGEVTIFLVHNYRKDEPALDILTIGSSGYALDDQMSTAIGRQMYEELLTDFDPHLITFEMKDPETVTPTDTFTTAFDRWCDVVDTGAALADRLVFSANPYVGASASTQPGQETQHDIMKAEVNSRRDNWLWFDTARAYGTDSDDYGYNDSPGDTIHSNVNGRMHAAHTALTALGLGSHPWGFMPLPVNAIGSPSKFAWDTEFGPGTTFAGFQQYIRFREGNSGLDVELEYPRSFEIVEQDGTVSFRVSSLPTTSGFESAFPSNGFILLDGDRTYLKTNQSAGGVKGIKLEDKTTGDLAPLQALFYSPPIAAADAPSLTNGLLQTFDSGGAPSAANGAGLYFCDGSVWTKIS